MPTSGITIKPTSGLSSYEFWYEYVTVTCNAYGLHPAVDPASDPMWVAIDDWYRTIDTATTKAVAEGFIYLDWGVIQPLRPSEIILRFIHPDGRRFECTLAIDGRFERHGKPLTRGDIKSLMFALRSIIYAEGHVRLPPPKLKFQFPRLHQA
jgi:hypothetical protein